VWAGIARLEAELARRPGFGEPIAETSPAGDVSRIIVPIAGDPVSDRAIAAVRDLRDEVVPRAFAGVDAEVLVSGATAEELDYHTPVDSWLARVFVFVLGLSFVLLRIAFRSWSR
jgi:RND superfamily putative drug exporter